MGISLLFQGQLIRNSGTLPVQQEQFGAGLPILQGYFGGSDTLLPISPSSSFLNCFIMFGQSTPAFGQSQPSLFGQSAAQGVSTPFGQQSTPFGQTPGSVFGAPQQVYPSSQLTTQMAPVAPVVIPLADREVQAVIDAYKEEPGNPKYAFKHLLLSVTDPTMRAKPVGVSDIMWAEAMNSLAGMDSADRERLWPELVQGFKDLSNRMKLQDECIAADVQRLQATETNVKLLHRHFDTDTVPWIQLLRLKEQELQRRLLRVMRIVEALEGKGFRLPLTRAEAKVGEQLRTLTRQLQGPTAELPRKVDALLSRSRMLAGEGQNSALFLGPGKIEEQSLGNMHEVLRQQTEAIAHLTSVLKRDTRDVDIMLSGNTDMVLDGDAVFYSSRKDEWHGMRSDQMLMPSVNAAQGAG
ncbi:hypothetical protein R1flu_010782 [Riccia fluitans]|uniref:Nucleoporin Nup54 alpha-helical domain-containing protein n=1 Tax=Riccia fluitans TaxID=41844 RepID=A0ABD1Z648_9MARC